MKVGLGITTFNRVLRLAKTIDAVKQFTETPMSLVVADDGSDDGTLSFLESQNIDHFSTKNRGIAWNKNRLLYYFTEVERSDVVILLEDDTNPVSHCWERVWIESALRYGHMNYAGPWFRSSILSGAGTPQEPFRSLATSGQCVSFSRSALQTVGYMDTRFKAYGYEHGEHTTRLIRAGFGGDPKTGQIYLIDSAINVTDSGDHADPIHLEANAAVMEEVRNDSTLYRPAWRNEDEASDLFEDLRNLRLYSFWEKMRLVVHNLFYRRQIYKTKFPMKRI